MRVRAANVALIGLWVAWAAPLVPWLARGFSRDDGLAQLLVGVLTVGAVARTVDVRAAWTRLGAPPHLQPVAAVLAVAGPLAAVAFGSIHDSVRALCVVVAGYGLVGLYAAPDRWRDLRPVAGLAVLVLPILLMVDVILGWPLRKLIAEVAAAMLGGIPVETVIRVEGGFAHIDVPCAGFRGLWTLGALFLLSTLLRGRTVDRGWIAAAAVGSTVLIAANIVRVVVVVGIGHVLRWPLVAESVHQPLGVLGFLLALGVAAFVPTCARVTPSSPAPARWLPVILAIALAGAIVRPVPERIPVPSAPVAVPAGWTAIPPSSAELAFAAEYGGALTKARQPRTGASIVLVESRSWLAHHVPEHCLRADGWTVSDDRPAEVDGGAVRIVTVTRDGVQATAVWWFQGADQTTDDLVVRIRQGWRTGAPWVLVSVLLPGVREASDPDLTELITSVRQSVDDSLDQAMEDS